MRTSWRNSSVHLITKGYGQYSGNPCNRPNNSEIICTRAVERCIVVGNNDKADFLHASASVTLERLAILRK